MRILGTRRAMDNPTLKIETEDNKSAITCFAGRMEMQQSYMSYDELGRENKK